MTSHRTQRGYATLDDADAQISYTTSMRAVPAIARGAGVSSRTQTTTARRSEATCATHALEGGLKGL